MGAKMVAGRQTQASKRAEDYAAMLEESLRRLGVREVMEVYGAWQRIDENLRDYRAAMAMAAGKITTTDHANDDTQAHLVSPGKQVMASGVGGGSA